MHIDNVHKHLEYYVLCEDFNKSKVRKFNIFNHGYIYEQIEPNIDIIAKYVIEMYNKVKRKKLII